MSAVVLDFPTRRHLSPAPAPLTIHRVEGTWGCVHAAAASNGVVLDVQGFEHAFLGGDIQIGDQGTAFMPAGDIRLLASKLTLAAEQSEALAASGAAPLVPQDEDEDDSNRWRLP